MKKSSSNIIRRIFSVGQPLPGISLLALTIALISALQFPANLIMKSVSTNLGIMINEILIIAGLPLILVFYFGFDRPKLFPFDVPKVKTWILAILISIPVAMLIDYAASASESILPMPTKYHDMLNELMAVATTKDFLIKLLVLSVLPGICEEIFFRGFFQTSIEARWGTKIAVVITAALFALLHGNPWYFHLYFILGFFLSWIFAVSRTLWIPIICHTINNAWTFINHTLGIEYPVRGPFDPLDLALISGGILLVIVFAYCLKKSFHLRTD